MNCCLHILTQVIVLLRKGHMISMTLEYNGSVQVWVFCVQLAQYIYLYCQDLTLRITVA